MLKDIQKIAVFRALQLGDMLCMIPAVRALKQACPDAAITLIGLPGKAGFAQRFGHYFSDFMTFPGWPGLPEQPVVPAHTARFLLEAQQQQFDLVLQMQGAGTHTNELCYLMGGRITAGLRAAGVWAPDEQLFPLMTESEHEILRLLKIVHALGIPSDSTAMEFPVSPAEAAQAAMIMGTLGLREGKYICMHPGARDPRRRWPPGHFAYIGDAMAAKGYSILITGSADERELTAAVATQMQYPAIDLVARAGQTSIGEMAALIRHSATLLSNDTGVSHIAAALAVPSVIIFSPYSDPGRWAPLDHTLHTAVPADSAHDLAYVLEALENAMKLNADSYESIRADSDL